MWAFFRSLSSYWSWFVYEYCFSAGFHSVQYDIGLMLCDIWDVESWEKDVDQHNACKIHRALEQAFWYLEHEDMKNWRIFKESLKPKVEWRMQFYKNCKICIMFENQPMLGICKLLDWNFETLCTLMHLHIRYCTWWHDCVNIARTIRPINHLFKHFEYSLKNVWDLTCRKYGITFWL
jgi:hypothetical protein